MDLRLGFHALQHHGVSHSLARMGEHHRESQDAALFPGEVPQDARELWDGAVTDRVRPWGTVKQAWKAWPHSEVIKGLEAGN